jgi:hypothetical protein
VEVIGLLVFVYVPATLPNTLTEMVQFALAESVAPLKLIRDVLAVAVVVPPVSVPVVQEVAKPLGVTINNPVGRVSEKPTPVKELVLELISVKRNTLLFPCWIGDVRKLFERVGSEFVRGQPVITTLSIHRLAEPTDFSPSALILKEVVPVPDVVAAYV